MKMLVVGFMLAMTVGICAQTAPPITGYEVQVYRSTDDPAGVPFRIQSITPGSVTCNLTPTPIPTGNVVNPRFVEFDDLAIAGRACQINVSTFITSIPIATGYRATLTALSSAGTSARSNVSNVFSVGPVPPAPPTQVGVRP